MIVEASTVYRKETLLPESNFFLTLRKHNCYGSFLKEGTETVKIITTCPLITIWETGELQGE
jgi:hypothetical protein